MDPRASRRTLETEKKKFTNSRLDEGLEEYQQLCCEHTQPVWKARLRGIAVCSNVATYTEGRLMAAARNLLILWLAGKPRNVPGIVRRRVPPVAGATTSSHRYILQPPKEILVAFHAHFVRFNKLFPRGITGEGCWAVQVVGLRACVECPAETNEDLCLGMDIRRTGRTSHGLEVPISNYSGPP